ncbi:MAG: zinc ribbon domain-containing protein [Vicinamibacteria bacterium]
MTTTCGGCGAPVSGRFCASCGRPVSTQPRSAGPWIYVGGALVLAAVFALGLLVGRGHGGATAALEGAPPVASSGTEAAPPDISNMSPRERFDRLYDRVMRASSSGDNATVERFGPMAIAAYGMLDSVDIDARYDVAVLKLHVGDIPGAKALADSMVRMAPKHLFGYMIKATVARFSGDSATAKAAGAAFLRNYSGEMAKALPEYTKHQTSIDAFKRQVENPS